MAPLLLLLLAGLLSTNALPRPVSQILREYHEAHPDFEAQIEPITLSPASRRAQWTIVWLCDKEWEKEYFEHVLFAPFLNARELSAESEECRNDAASCIGDGVVLVVGRKSYTEQHLLPERYLHAAQQARASSVVIHVSDEQCDMDTRWYNLASLVLRQYWCEPASLSGPHVITIPDGLKNGWDFRHEIKLAAERKCAWAFHGHIGGGDRTAVRTAMRDEMMRVPTAAGCAPAMVQDGLETQKVEGADYTAAMCNTIIAPCPRGFGLETFRFSEALECGAIPIVDDAGKVFHKYMPGILDHVITTTVAWNATITGEPLADVVQALLKDPVALERRRLGVTEWYHEYKRNLMRKVQHVIDTTPPRL